MSTGVYAICYQEADWLAFNVRRMYGWVDKFSIVVGPVEVLKAPEDTETAELLRAIPDPDGKITVVSGVWKNKNVMCDKAVAGLDTEVILQLDSDEIWPREAFDEAMELMAKGKRKLKLHMYTFWKQPDVVLGRIDVDPWLAELVGAPIHLVRAMFEGLPGGADGLRQFIHSRVRISRSAMINGPQMQELGKAVEANKWTLAKALLETFHGPVPTAKEADMLVMLAASPLPARLLDGPWTPWLLDMHRVFRPTGHAKIGHLPPDLVWPNGESADWHRGATLETPLWHFSYMGLEHVARKFAFFNARDGEGAMPNLEVWQEWTEEHLGAKLTMTGQRRTFLRYDGPPIPDDILAFVKGAA